MENQYLAKKSRENKPDFKPYYTRHRKMLETPECGVDMEDIIRLRKLFHQYPEGHLKEFKTQKLIKDTLVGFGIPAEDLKDCAGTGVIVDICGTGSEGGDAG